MPSRSRKNDRLLKEQAGSAGKRVVKESVAKKKTSKKKTSKKKAAKKKISKKVSKKVSKKATKAEKAGKKKVSKKKVSKKATKATKAGKKKVSKKASSPVKKPPRMSTEPASGFRWLSVSAEEGAEIRVAKSLGRVREIREVLLPMHNGAALYPGYVFVDCDRSDDGVLCGICQIDNVDGILARDGIFNYASGGHEPPVELEETALRSIRDSCARYARRVRDEMLLVEKGQQITITTGTFNGMAGEIISVNRRKMSVIAKVRLSDGGMLRKVSVEYGQFEITEEKEDDGWRL